MSVEEWKSLFDVAAVVLLFLTFAAGAGVLVTGNIINKRQEEKLKTFDVELTSAKTELAKQQERAATAESNIAIATQHAAEANALAEKERLERIKIEERLDGWRLDANASEQLTNQVKQFPDTPYDLYADPAEVRFMDSLDKALASAGWKRMEPKMAPARPGYQSVTMLLAGKAGIRYSAGGVFIEFAQSRLKDWGTPVQILTESLTKAGVDVKVQTFTFGDDSAVHVTIGRRE